MSERSCENCKNLKANECRFFPVDCWTLGLLTKDLQGRMASICKHYEERESVCGAKIIFRGATFCCTKKSIHKGDHSAGRAYTGADFGFIWSHHDLEVPWPNPTPTAFEKAWEECLEKGHRFGWGPDEKWAFGKGWQAALDEVRGKLPQSPNPYTVVALHEGPISIAAFEKILDECK